MAYWEDTHSQSADLNLNVKVLDFIKSGGLIQTQLPSARPVVSELQCLTNTR